MIAALPRHRIGEWGLRDYGFEQIFGGDPDCKHDFGIIHRRSGDKSGPHGPGSILVSTRKAQYKIRKGEPTKTCSKCHAWKGQLGLEPTPEFYIEHLTEIFNEVKRALKKGGTLWLNISDTYSGSGGAGGDYNLDGLKEGQPKYKQGKIFNNKYKKIDAAWLAAFIDSEGTIQIHKQRRGNNSPSYQPHIAIAMVQREMLDKAYSITRVGSVWKMNYKTSTGKNVYQWSVRGQQGKELIEEVYSYLILKKKQAAILWMLCKNLKDKKDGKRVKPENLKYREILYNAVKELNQLRNPDIKIIEPMKSRFQSKCLCMVPERLAWSLIQNDWILRNKIIWFKPNSMPSSVKDRFNNKWEYLFLFSKNRKYYFDLDAVREPHKYDGRKDTIYKGGPKDMQIGKHERWPDPSGKNPGDIINVERKWDKVPGQTTQSIARDHGGWHRKDGSPTVDFEKGKNPDDFWPINTQPFPEAHFAVFPEKLCEKPIKAGSPKDGIVLDPFCGVGTALYVAKELRRRYIGIDIKKEYCELAEKRLAQGVL